MVSFTSASRDVMAAWLYQSRSSMYIRGLIPWNCSRQFRLSPTSTPGVGSNVKASLFVLKVVMLHSKLKGMKRLTLHKPLSSVVGVEWQNIEISH